MPKPEIGASPPSMKSQSGGTCSTKELSTAENFTIDGKKAKKVWRSAEDGKYLGDDQVLSIYFVDKGKKVIFTCYPSYSSLLKECDSIVGSFSSLQRSVMTAAIAAAFMATPRAARHRSRQRQLPQRRSHEVARALRPAPAVVSE